MDDSEHGSGSPPSEDQAEDAAAGVGGGGGATAITPPSSPFFVRSGRGKRSYESEGNQFMMKLACARLPEYKRARSNNEKSQIISEIVEHIKEKGGLFFDEDLGKVATDRVAQIKVAQFMRFKKRQRLKKRQQRQDEARPAPPEHEPDRPALRPGYAGPRQPPHPATAWDSFWRRELALPPPAAAGARRHEEHLHDDWMPPVPAIRSNISGVEQAPQNYAAAHHRPMHLHAPPAMHWAVEQGQQHVAHHQQHPPAPAARNLSPAPFAAQQNLPFAVAAHHHFLPLSPVDARPQQSPPPPFARANDYTDDGNSVHSENAAGAPGEEGA